jgi:hypothetical protein
MQKKKLPRDPNALPDLSAMTGAQVGNPPILSEEPQKNPTAGVVRRLRRLKGGKAIARNPPR